MLVFIRVFFHANCGLIVLLEVSFIGHAKFTVIFLFYAESRSEFRGPPRRIVGPVTFPLARTPGIPKSAQPHILTLVHKFIHSEKRISVTGDNS
jgi:hypothetical protein